MNLDAGVSVKRTAKRRKRLDGGRDDGCVSGADITMGQRKTIMLGVPRKGNAGYWNMRLKKMISQIRLGVFFGIVA